MGESRDALIEWLSSEVGSRERLSWFGLKVGCISGFGFVAVLHLHEFLWL